ncbi:hypothetical protein FTUN_6817 [Frigoriglobus tundricola]|uniref:Uncharacterized protein n=1 Tax=Frigoriglobus tundricola TaxID=2774151 RepID=A0A6M5YZ29_9BACT|nr:hypothetical protein FTUN_6817 [Frigoriglobus tundricola]
MIRSRRPPIRKLSRIVHPRKGRKIFPDRHETQETQGICRMTGRVDNHCAIWNERVLVGGGRPSRRKLCSCK